MTVFLYFVTNSIFLEISEFKTANPNGKWSILLMVPRIHCMHLDDITNLHDTDD